MPTAEGDSALQKISGSDLPSGIGMQSPAVAQSPDGQPKPMEPGADATDPDGQKEGTQPKPPRVSSGTAGGGVPGPAEIWLDGGVLACACPGCGAPMSIRLWLRLADCWRCGTSIELTEEQERAAWQLLRQQAAQSQAPSGSTLLSAKPAAEASAPIAIPKSSPVSVPPAEVGKHKVPTPDVPCSCQKERVDRGLATEGKPPRPTEAAWGASKTGPSAIARVSQPSGENFAGAVPTSVPRGRRRIAAAERLFRQRLRLAQRGRPWHQRVQDWLKNLPAWLISFLLHMVAMLLLALWIPEEKKPVGIVFSASIGPYDLETELGEHPQIEVRRPEFDEGGLAYEPLSLQDVLGDPNLEKTLLDPGLHRPDSSLQPPDPLISEQAPALRAGSLLRGRDPTVRNKILYSQGGTSATEAAVARALRWISRHQNADGSFSLHAFNRTSDCQGQCSGEGTTSDVAGTALALLPMLGAGQTHQQGEYASVVRAGLQWLLARQKEDGDLREPGLGQMYSHGLASIVLCEAYALTGDSQLRQAAQRALNFILQAQHPEGGWRYQPGQAGDTSMVGWQLMALNSGRMAGLQVPTETLMKASRYLDSAQTDRAGSKYGYMPGLSASPAMTAEALLCRQYLGWPRDHAGLRGGIRFLLERHPPNAKEFNIYYWYYAAQVFHHYGGPEWERWNTQMRRILVDSQVRTGHAAGSWNPDPYWGQTGGRLYQTALAACTLEVYYRYLPLYRPQAVGESLSEGAKSPAPPFPKKTSSDPTKEAEISPH
ncbi:MAG: terpene cyclase/mutase family protein [Thermoguttaceae bacterium]|nr:terpene cyclase/mutase family protein [Thermoguttaceae bacterium]MDW8036497.1 terpene cyclase/mutase family protein [Thermoguttaceae bacterium]